MKLVALKGDDYEMFGQEWKDTASDPSKQTPPPPSSPDPEDPQKYSEPPSYPGLASIVKEDAPDTGSEFVFCNGKVVATDGYTISILTRTLFDRKWELDEKGHIKGGAKDEVKSVDRLEVKAKGLSDFVSVGGAAMCCMNDGVAGGSKKIVYKDGVPEEVGDLSAEGEFIECSGHVYFTS